MSTYTSDPDLDMWDDDATYIDVASNGTGADVRLSCPLRDAYLTPDEARRVAEALLRRANATEAARAFWAGDAR